MNRLIKNLYNDQYAFSIISKIFGVLIGFAFSIVYSRYFGAELRGEAAIITNYIGMLYIFLCMGMYQAYPCYRKGLSEEEVKKYYKQYINDTFGLFFVYLVVAAALFMLLHIETNYRLVILLLPSEFLIKQLNYVVLIENPKLRNLTSVKLNIFEFVFVLALMFLIKANYYICIAFVIIKQMVNLIFAVENLKINLLTIRPSLSKSIPKFMRFGLVPMISTLLMTANYKMDILMLDAFDNVSVGEVGIYSLGVQLAERIWMIPDALKDILLSKLSKGKTESEVAKVIRISLPIMLIFVLGIIVLGQPFISFVYGKEFVGAYKVTVFILLGTVCMVFYKMINSYYIVEGLRIRSFVMLGITAIMNISVNALLIPKYGMIGAAIASLVSYVLCGTMFVVTFLHRTKLPLKQLFIIQKKDIQQILKKIMK